MKKTKNCVCECSESALTGIKIKGLLQIDVNDGVAVYVYQPGS